MNQVNQDNKVMQNTPKHTLLCAAIFCGLMVFGGYQIIAASMNPDLEYPKSLKAFKEGEMTQTLEKQLDLKLPIRSTSIAFANTIRYQLFGGSGEQVRSGKDDWLFIAEELKFEGPTVRSKAEVDTAAALNTRIDLVTGLAKRLEAQGVKLVVALVPDKARLYADKLKSADYPSYNQLRYQTAFDSLQKNGITTVNLLQALAPMAKQKEIYYRTDTHWNQIGAAIAAKEIAAVVQNLKIDLPRTTFTTRPEGAPQERSGDLLRLMGLEFVPNVLRPKPDQEIAEITVEAASAKEPAKGANLFGDVGVPVVLAGTSYSLRANFHGRLQEFLSAKVLNTAKDGGGFLQAMTAYLKDESFRSSKPQVLVWEIPERMLQSPLKDEKGWLEKSLPAAK
jgi:alginate O-acetyltransferase complex protein AlgJ